VSRVVRTKEHVNLMDHQSIHTVPRRESDRHTSERVAKLTTVTSEAEVSEQPSMGATTARPPSTGDLPPPPLGRSTLLDFFSFGAVPDQFSDAASEFRQAIGEKTPQTPSCADVAEMLQPWVNLRRDDKNADFTFSIEIPRLGNVDGDVTTVNGRTIVQLRASRGSSTKFLSSRRSALQEAVQLETGGDITLSIAD
jgi:hypothetical protein